MSTLKSRSALQQSMEPINGKVQPPVVPIRPGRVTNKLKYLKDTVLPAMLADKNAWPFHAPVDTIKLKLPDYFQVVKFPMDLGTVKKRLENRYYQCAKDCILEINLIFANCYMYNPSGDDVVLMGEQLEKVFRETLAEMPKVEMDDTSTRGQTTAKQIEPQASATQADPAVPSSSGLQKSSARSSIGSRFPVTPTPTPTTTTTNIDVSQRASVIVYAPSLAAPLKCSYGLPTTMTKHDDIKQQTATGVLGFPSGSRHNLETVGMPMPSTSSWEQPTTAEDVPRSALKGASAELTLATERSSECQPAPIVMITEFDNSQVQTNSSIPDPIAGPSTYTSYGRAAPRRRIAHVPKARRLLTALEPDAIEHGLSSGSRHNLETVGTPKPLTSSWKQPTTTENVPLSSLNRASAELTLATEKSSECQPAPIVPFFGFGNVEYSPSSITTTEFDTTPNYSTATGNLSLEDDYTSNVLISTPMVSSSAIDNDVEMVADSLSTSDEALENLAESNQLGDNNGHPEGLQQPHSHDLTRLWRVLPIVEEVLEAENTENVRIPPIVIVRVGRDRPVQRLRLDRQRIHQETIGVFRQCDNVASGAADDSNIQSASGSTAQNTVPIPVAKVMREVVLDDFYQLLKFLYEEDSHVKKRAAAEEEKIFQSCKGEKDVDVAAVIYIDRVHEALGRIRAQCNDSMLYQQLLNHILTLDEQRNNGYPRPTPDPDSGRVIVDASLLFRTMEAVEGLAGKQNETVTDGKPHLTEGGSLIHLEGFVRSIPRRIMDHDVIFKTYALHCDYCMTSAGPAIAHIVVISSNCKTVYETHVRPDHTITHFDSRIVGMSHTDFVQHVETTIRDVQQKLLQLLCDKTILIGHGVQFALLALRMTHDTVVDTSIVYRSYQPAIATRKTLHDLCQKYLDINMEHEVDSSKYAVACMQLMLHKINWKIK